MLLFLLCFVFGHFGTHQNIKRNFVFVFLCFSFVFGEMQQTGVKHQSKKTRQHIKTQQTNKHGVKPNKNKNTKHIPMNGQPAGSEGGMGTDLPNLPAGCPFIGLFFMLSHIQKTRYVVFSCFPAGYPFIGLFFVFWFYTSFVAIR